ncbi:MAG: hypothetical protein ACRD9L_28135 [Bryobacteraceae bacterium]
MRQTRQWRFTGWVCLINDQRRLALYAFQKAYERSRGVTHALAGRKKAAGNELAKLHEFARQNYVPAV